MCAHKKMCVPPQNPKDQLMSKSKRPPRKPPEDEPEWLKESRRKWTPEAIKAAEEEEAKREGDFLKAWLKWATTNNNTTGKPAEVIDLAAYRKKKQITE